MHPGARQTLHSGWLEERLAGAVGVDLERPMNLATDGSVGASFGDVEVDHHRGDLVVEVRAPKRNLHVELSNPIGTQPVDPADSVFDEQESLVFVLPGATLPVAVQVILAVAHPHLPPEVIVLRHHIVSNRSDGVLAHVDRVRAGCDRHAQLSRRREDGIPDINDAVVGVAEIEVDVDGQCGSFLLEEFDLGQTQVGAIERFVDARHGNLEVLHALSVVDRHGLRIRCVLQLHLV